MNTFDKWRRLIEGTGEAMGDTVNAVVTFRDKPFKRAVGGVEKVPKLRGCAYQSRLVEKKRTRPNLYPYPSWRFAYTTRTERIPLQFREQAMPSRTTV